MGTGVMRSLSHPSDVAVSDSPFASPDPTWSSSPISRLDSKLQGAGMASVMLSVVAPEPSLGQNLYLLSDRMKMGQDGL